MKLILSTVLLLFTHTVYGSEYDRCDYEAIEPSLYQAEELEILASCVRNDQGVLTINPIHLERMAFNSWDIAKFTAYRRTYLVNRNGRIVLPVKREGYTDYFQEGLSRTDVDGKIGYFNQDLEIVIEPQYDWGMHFVDGKALVCIGCERIPDECSINYFISGGKWGYINKQGIEVVPIIYDQHQLQP
uniref:WG repeat-containing protein n=1 Tax=Thaumasiovibrio occultus TaxID=1891184 RepID=UPI000B3542C4|nr:WG repeat-containing protein [Thaumasiovibrio occultus]